MDDLVLHPLVRRWFEATFAAPTEPQEAAWREIAAGKDTLVAAPTGSGKTLAAFLWALDRLVGEAEAGPLEDRIDVVYVSPLKALGNDIEKNLRIPLDGIRGLAEESGRLLPEIRVGVRTGDTSTRERELQARRPPHILITTPESLYILLTAARGRKALRDARVVIVDEIHATAQDKRGLHLALSLERLDRVAGRRLQRIGLSATQKPIETMASLLVGTRPECAIVDTGHRRSMELSIETLGHELGPIASHELMASAYDRIAALTESHRTTIVFVNTRRLVERVAHALAERLGPDRVAAHHGSLSRTTRLAAEEGLKSGRVPVVVATASLELGIDVGHVDLVCHLGAPRAIATLLQRVGRSGHFLGAVPKGILFPTTRDDLVQAAAAIRAVRSGELDRLSIRENARDVLAQQIVAEVAAEESSVEELWDLVRRAHPYRNLDRRRFDDVLEMLAEGVSSRRGRRAAHLHYDRVNGRLRARRGARLAAITSGGAIPDTADYEVVEDATGSFVGKVNEDFAIESMAGDIFQLGNHSWRIRRVEAGKVRVVDAEGLPPTIPFWLGEAPGRTLELSAAVADLRREVAERRHDPPAAILWLREEAAVDESGAAQIVAYVADTMRVLGAVPTLETIVAERFFDEAGGQQLVLHAPFGARINRAFGLALRKRFCVTFDFELQAAATDDGIVISLGEQHSFPLVSVFSMIRRDTLGKDLVQAVLPSPMFGNRWRWNATRSLVLLRHTGGKRVPMPIQRMRADDLLAAVFPAQAACQDNRTGPVEPVPHPLVDETIDDCLGEAMDTKGFEAVLDRIADGHVATLAVETPAPSPMCHEILNANPYAFLDDAPLEERRARAVSLRRTDPDLASGIGALDAEIVREVQRQAWPLVESPDELHDVLLSLFLVPTDEIERSGWTPFLEDLLASGRAARVRLGRDRDREHAAATERLAALRRAFPDLRTRNAVPDVTLPGRLPETREEALTDCLRGWMDALGPVREREVAERSGLTDPEIAIAMARLEAEGAVLRGAFSSREGDVEWCERGLLARIHRGTLGKLRREILAFEPADFVRFLLEWQHVAPNARLHGRSGVLEVVTQLRALELPGPAWERDVLPARVVGYDPDDLEALCLSGELAWGRIAVGVREGDPVPEEARRRRTAPTRQTPLAFFLREELARTLAPLPEDGIDASCLSPLARDAARLLERNGASFLADVARDLACLPTEAEDALWELVAAGLVTGDGIAGLRTLLLPEEKRRSRLRTTGVRLRSLSGGRARRLVPAGRWSLLRRGESSSEDERTDAACRRLLERWGIVFRDLAVRERGLPPWREILLRLRRMEARGEIRGGRFVNGFVGEQFALPEAIEASRALRRSPGSDDPVVVSAADPLNLVGVVLAGERVSPFSGQVIAYRNGCVVEIGELGAVRSRLRASLAR